MLSSSTGESSGLYKTRGGEHPLPEDSGDELLAFIGLRPSILHDNSSPLVSRNRFLQSEASNGSSKSSSVWRWFSRGRFRHIRVAEVSERERITVKVKARPTNASAARPPPPRRLKTSRLPLPLHKTTSPKQTIATYTLQHGTTQRPRNRDRLRPASSKGRDILPQRAQEPGDAAREAGNQHGGE